MMGSAKFAALLLLLAVSLALDTQVKPAQCTGVLDVESAQSSSPDSQAGFRTPDGEEDSAQLSPTSRARTLQSVTQSQLLRLLRARQSVQSNHSVERDNSLDDHQSAKEDEAIHGARRINLEKVKFDAKTGIPVQQLKDLVTELPGQPPVKFAQYAGYVTVNETAGRALFYYFVEATSSPEEKPLLLWLNGGPGCSSLGYGAFEELGPFRVKSDGKTLHRNHYAWNKLANIIFLESPAGVGFSYSNTSSDYASNGDNRTASDSLTFLLNWFERFPQYKYRDFYITGESYAGFYVPQLTQRVVNYNKGLEKPVMNLKGFMVGNAVIDAVQDDRGTVDYWWTHALISDETYALLQPCLTTNSNYCNNVANIAYNEQGNLDPYDIYLPACLDPLTDLKKRHSKLGRLKGYDPCLDNYVTAYLNRPDVQKALHANVTKVNFPWTPCSDIVFDTWEDSASSVIPIYKELIPTGLKIWVYSGDVDSVVPVTATKYSLQLLKLKTKIPWYPWYRSKQVGGYTQGYEGLTLVTVRNSGHEVPLYQPARGLSLITSYLSGVALPPEAPLE